jgi:hypothetical protein
VVLDVRPGHGIGPIQIGMTRSEARDAARDAGLAVEEFRRGGGDGPPDFVIGRQLFAYFGEDGTVDEVEAGVSGPQRVAYGALDLTSSYAGVLEAMKPLGQVDETHPEYPSTSVFSELGLSLWADVGPQDLADALVAAILVRRAEPYRGN